MGITDVKKTTSAFSGVSSNMTRDNREHKLKYRIFHLNLSGSSKWIV